MTTMMDSDANWRGCSAQREWPRAAHFQSAPAPLGAGCGHDVDQADDRDELEDDVRTASKALGNVRNHVSDDRSKPVCEAEVFVSS